MSPHKHRCIYLVFSLMLSTGPSSIVGIEIARDDASDEAYVADPSGAWTGLNPESGENPPGNDNGGFGFRPWDFVGGFHQPVLSPYGNLNHFVDGVDFSTREFNDLGAPAFGLTNANQPFFGHTARATRTFKQPLAPGDVLSVDFDNPLHGILDPFDSSGYLLRLNTGGGPVINSNPIPGVVERFGLFTTSNFNDGRWYTTDSVAFTDTAIETTKTDSGTQFRFSLTGTETYEVELIRLSDGVSLFSRNGSLNNAESGTIDTLEIALFGNGSSSDGSREFFFNNLKIEGQSDLRGDLNGDGTVDAADAGMLFANWGSVPPGDSNADLNNDYLIDAADAGILFSVWTGDNALNVVPEPMSGWIHLCLLITVARDWARRSRTVRQVAIKRSMN